MSESRGRPCSIAAALQIVGDRWSLLAVREVLFGNHRFSEIVRNTGAPRDRLAARLKDLVASGVLETRQYQNSPVRFDYHLTRAGRELTPVLHSLLEWGDKWALNTSPSDTSPSDTSPANTPPVTIRHHAHKLRTRTVCATCGESVQQRDISRESNIDGWTMTGPTG